MNQDRSDEPTILTSSDPEFLAELSEYLDVLASPVRLRILSFLGKKPRTVRQISSEIETSYENTKKHLIRLVSLGLLRREIGVSDEPANQGQPVFYYVLVPDGLRHALRNLSVFTSGTGPGLEYLSDQALAARAGLQQIIPPAGPGLTVTTGPQKGVSFELTADQYRVGRMEDGWDGMIPEPAILLDDGYRSVSRVSRPHAWVRKKAGFWSVAEGNSKGGTWVNGRRISHDPTVMTDGDLIELSPGSLGVTLVFHSGTSSHP